MKSDYLEISDKVQQALQNHMPVIAVETAGIYLGLNGEDAGKSDGERPDYSKIAEAVEKLIIQNGAVPALVAVIDGKVHVGLNREKRMRLNDEQETLVKVSRRDLPMVLAVGKSGVLTVAATMMVSESVGIPVMVTVGIGGVSEDFTESMDVSADLEELIHSQIVVVSTGVNPGVHPGKTLEYLETHGVPVIGYQTDAFYTRWRDDVKHPLKYRVEDPLDIARVLAVKRSLDISGSILVMNPSQKEYNAADSYDPSSGGENLTHLLDENATLGAWIASALTMDLTPKPKEKKEKSKKEKSMSFEVWLFAVKGFAQNFDVAQLIFNNLPDSEKERLRQEYEDTVD